MHGSCHFIFGETGRRAAIPPTPYYPYCTKTNKPLVPWSSREQHECLWAVYLFEADKPVEDIGRHLVVSLAGKDEAMRIGYEFVHNHRMQPTVKIGG